MQMKFEHANTFACSPSPFFAHRQEKHRHSKALPRSPADAKHIGHVLTATGPPNRPPHSNPLLNRPFYSSSPDPRPKTCFDTPISCQTAWQHPVKPLFHWLSAQNCSPLLRCAHYCRYLCHLTVGDNRKFRPCGRPRGVGVPPCRASGFSRSGPNHNPRWVWQNAAPTA